MNKLDYILGFCLGVIIVACIIILLGGFIFMLLWNWIAPLFSASVPILTFWQSCGVVTLLLFISHIFRNNNKN